MPVAEGHRGYHGVGNAGARLRIAQGIVPLMLFAILLVAPLWLSPGVSLAQDAAPGALQPTPPSTAPKSVVWDQIDVTVALREDSSFHVTERDRVAFTGGPFRTGYREIPLARIEEIDNIRVGTVEGDRLQPFRYVAPGDFSASMPHTYTFREIGPNLRLDWSFPATTSQSRTFQIEYDAHGALRVYDDVEMPYQQISWISVDRALTETAPVNAASLTFILPRPVDPGETFIQGTGGGFPEDHTADGQTWVWTATDLGPGESLEAGLQFLPLVPAEKPAWQDAADRQEQQDSDVPGVATPVAAIPHASASPVAMPMAVPPCREVMANDFKGKTRDLLADCTTDRPIFVPEAWVFDGGGHTIFALDPVDGKLTGGVVMVTGASGTVQNVTIDGIGLVAPCAVDDGETFLAGLYFSDASGEASGVTVRNLIRDLPADVSSPSVRTYKSCGVGIVVVGADEPVVIAGNAIEDVAYAGIVVESGRASISHNTINHAAIFGIHIVDAQIRITPGNRITNGFIGIQLEGAGSGGRIAGNTIETMTDAGISITSGAHVSVGGNTVRDVGDTGIVVFHVGTTATIDANTVTDSASVGIWVRDGARAEVTGNVVADATDDGIASTTGAEVAITGGNRISGVSRGISAIGPDTTAEISENSIERASIVGITVADGATAPRVSDNVVSAAKFGITVLGAGTSATVTGNSVSDLETTGYTVESGANAELRQNRITGAGWGIVVTGVGTTADLSENRIDQTATAGIVLATGSQTTATFNTVSAPGITGIRIADAGTTATVRGSSISGASETGIKVEDGAHATIEDGNQVAGGKWGISILDSMTSAEVHGNDVSGVTNQGISVLYEARATVSDNAITGGATGVLVKDRGAAIVEGNTIHDVTYAGIEFEHTPVPAAITPAATSAGGVAIVSLDISFDPTTVTIPANTDVTVVLPNRGAAAHNFSIDELGIDIDIPAGETLEIVINAPAGEYEYYCDVPGHKEAGMVGTLIVSADTDTPVAATPVASPLATPVATPAAPAQPDEAIRRNTITGGQFGIVVMGAGPVLPVEENDIRSVEKTGISIEDEASADLERNTVSGATAGINIARTGTMATLTGNRVENTTERGMVVQLGAKAVMRQNVVSAAGTSGIAVGGSGTTATLEGNIVINAAEHGIVIEEAATATIDKANYVTGGQWGISILSAGTSAEVRGNRVRNVANQGISVLYGAQATVDGNTVEGGDSGIYLGSAGTTVTVTGNWVSNPVTNGIRVFEGATGERIEGNTVSGGVRAILITDAGSGAVVSANTVRDFSDIGIQMQKDASAEILDNAVDGGKWGIALNTGATATIQENTISGASNQGIAVVSGARATIDGNTVEGGDPGIYVVDPGSSAVIINNTVAADDQGIAIWDGATAERIEANTVTGGNEGIVVTGAGSTATVEANRISDVAHEGITARDGASATIRRNDVTHVISGWNILVRDRNTTATVEENTLTNSDGFGIQFSQGAHGSVNGNTLTGVTNTGIRLVDADTSAIVSGNSVRGARLGIEGRSSKITITDNIVADSGQVGIQLGPDAVVEVTGNTITGPDEPDPDRDGPYGVQVFHGVSGTIAGNQVANHRNPDPEHTACGIVIDAEAPNVVVTENLFPEPGNEVNMCDERPPLPPRSRVPQATPVSAATPMAPTSTPVPASTPVPVTTPGMA